MWPPKENSKILDYLSASDLPKSYPRIYVGEDIYWNIVNTNLRIGLEF